MSERNAPYRITDLAVTDRPRERLAKLGTDSLTNPELLDILLRVGVAGENALQLAPEHPASSCRFINSKQSARVMASGSFGMVWKNTFKSWA